jgi:hypothetical protein
MGSCRDSVNCNFLDMPPQLARTVSLPVGVENDRRVTTEQREFVRQLATLLQRKNGKSASTARLPIDCQVLRIDLDVASETSGQRGG